jgi:hypothetical protein
LEPFLQPFSRENWYISYHIPEETIIKLKGNCANETFSSEIAQKISIQGVAAISFSEGMYSWIKKYLEPKISNKVIYHGLTNLLLYEMDFKQKLLKNKLYLDKKVKTIEVLYESQFDL